jgi:crotonobetainyl-CoA:carnitine CoA-transferase CaiB-like acyl-CoA transferase
MAEAQDLEHNKLRQGFVEVDGTVRPNVAPRFEGAELSADAEVQLSGSGTREILGEINYDERRIAQLLDRGIVEAAD